MKDEQLWEQARKMKEDAKSEIKHQVGASNSTDLLSDEPDSTDRILTWIGRALIAIALVIIIFRRVAGIDLTEGQLFFQDLPWWILAIGCAIGGLGILHNTKGR